MCTLLCSAFSALVLWSFLFFMEGPMAWTGQVLRVPMLDICLCCARLYMLRHGHAHLPCRLPFSGLFLFFMERPMAWTGQVLCVPVLDMCLCCARLHMYYAYLRHGHAHLLMLMC